MGRFFGFEESSSFWREKGNADLYRKIRIERPNNFKGDIYLENESWIFYFILYTFSNEKNRNYNSWDPFDEFTK